MSSSSRQLRRRHLCDDGRAKPPARPRRKLKFSPVLIVPLDDMMRDNNERVKKEKRPPEDGRTEITIEKPDQRSDDPEPVDPYKVPRGVEIIEL